MELELAWAAGLFEGEGTIRINSATKRNLGHLAVSVVNTDRQIVDWFQARWPGSVKAATGLRPRQRPAWVWVIAARQAAVFLEAITPYLVRDAVRAKVAIALEFQGQKTGDPRINRTATYAEDQWSLYQQMRELNVRGAH